MLSLFFVATILPTALKPIVRADIIEVTIIVVIVMFKSNVLHIFTISNAPKVPDTIPHTSPTTSLHIEDTFVLFFIKKIDSLDFLTTSPENNI